MVGTNLFLNQTKKFLIYVFTCVLFVMQAVAAPSHTSNTFPNNELMQADYTYTGQATYENTGVYSDSVDANPEYEDVTYTCTSGQYLPAGATACATCPTGYTCAGGTFSYDANNDQGAIESKFTVTYSCGDGTGTAPTDSTQYDSDNSVTTLANTCTKSGYLFTRWSCGGNDVDAGDTFTINADTTCTAQYTAGKFTVTTTNLNANSTFSFSMSAAGTFTVDCGDGGVLNGDGVDGNTITRTNTTATIYTCTYSTAGKKTIRFDGTATGYNSETNIATISFYVGNNDANKAANTAKIMSVSGNLSALFPYIGDGANQQPRFYQTFMNATNLTSIPSTLFGGYTTGATYMFYSTFSGCTGLTSLPSDLFSGFTTGADYIFNYTFSGCTGLTSLPSDLFSGFITGNSYMFEYTFSGCTGLTSIPSDLFASFTTGAQYMFSGTFNVCTGLTTLPDGLFATFTTGAQYMFQNTFSGCSGLTSIPHDLFASIKTSKTGLFRSTFYGCTGLTSIPHDLFATFTTGASYMFYYTFQNCTGLTAIPHDLFATFTTGASYMFYETFYGCTGLTAIPHDLFATFTTGASYMFRSTFSGCTGLTSIPSDLFASFTTGSTYMFYYTFSGCTGLTSLPPGLFASVVSGANYMFNSTFYNCSNLSGYIPPTMFAGLIANGSPTYTGFMSNMFSNTGLATSCSAYPNTTKYTTGYESQWNSKVSCISTDTVNTVTYSCGDGTGTAPTDSNTYSTGVLVKTATNSCTAPSGVDFKNWSCNGVSVNAGAKFEISENTTCTAQYGHKFSVTTTSFTATEESPATVTFTMTAKGKFTVDCGDGGVLSQSTVSGNTLSGNTITRGNVTSTTYTCTYKTNGPKTIGFNGVATGYSTTTSAPAISFSTTASKTKVKSVDGDLSLLFPHLGTANGQIPRFYGTFNGVTALTSVSPELFSGYTIGASYMFYRTFYGCTGLTTIPTNLFIKFTNGASYMFYQTFQGCTKLTNLPEFSNITVGGTYMFYYTFYNCKKITGYVPHTMFAGLIGKYYYSNMMTNIFNTTTLMATSCTNYPDTTQYVTGFESYWSSRVSCAVPGTGKTVSYECGDGSGDAPNDAKQYAMGVNTTALANTCTTPTDKSFMNWSCNGTDVLSGEKFQITDDTICTAQYGTGTPVTITYNCGDGTGSTTDTSSPYAPGSTVIIKASSCTVPSSNKTFKNWSCNGVDVNANTEYTLNEDTVCTAQYSDKVQVTYDCGEGGGTPTSDTTKYNVGASVTTQTNACTVPTGKVFRGWLCGDKMVSASRTFTITENTTCTAQYIESKFAVTTTSVSSFSFTLTAAGTFTVVCGTGGVLSSSTTDVVGDTITRRETVPATYTCSYTSSSAKTIRFAGTATRYSTSTEVSVIGFSTKTYVASLAGNLAALFPQLGTENGQIPRFYQTFSGATNLTSIPSTLFSGYTNGISYMFSYTFSGCTGLTSLPSDLFASFTTGASYMFNYTFSSCAKLTTLPDDLFASFTTGADYMFQYTFRGCASLATIGDNMFANLTTGATYMFSYTFQNCTKLTNAPSFANLTTGGRNMFYYTFEGCTGLTTLPEGMFENLTTGATYMFFYTFSGCTGLTTLPEEMFSSLTTGATYMFYYTFSNCTGLTTLPSDLFSSLTTGAQYMFDHTFRGCTGLTTIGDNVFGGFTTGAEYMFSYTFQGCTGLTTLPDGMFSSLTTGAQGMFSYTFQGCTGLTTLPDGMFSSLTTGAQGMFSGTFSGCTGLTSLPSDLFSSLTTGAQSMFSSTFFGCTGLSEIPHDLFATFTTGASFMFYQTFYGCTGLTEIPNDLFASFTTGAKSMFYSTFSGCTGLTTLPDGLFASFTTGADYMFNSTFYNCTNLSGYIPPSMFAGLIARGSPTYNSFMYGIFSNTGLATSCEPYDMVQYMTGYENQWNSKVACAPAIHITYSCGAGTGTVPTDSTDYGFGQMATISANTCTPPAGGEFRKWECNGNAFNVGATFTITENTVCTAQYTSALNVTYSCGDGTGTAPVDSNIYLSEDTVMIADNTCIPPADKGFKNWSCNETNVGAGDTFIITERTTCTAQYDDADNNVTYSCGAGTGTAPTDSNSYASGANVTTLSNTCTAPENYDFKNWLCGETNVSAGGRFTITTNTTCVAQYTNYPFSVTTIELSENEGLVFSLSAAGTFTVDCGDDGVLYAGIGDNIVVVEDNIITRTNTERSGYACIYSTGGVKTIKFDGTATGYSSYSEVISFNNFNNMGAQYIASVSGDLSVIFPQLGTNDRQIPRFRRTFANAVNLTSIPSTLFRGFTTGAEGMFYDTFSGCTGLTTLPHDLFAGFTTGASYMFDNTFYNCTGLTSIPHDLFATFTTGAEYMFTGTFNDCTGLTSLPSDLFASFTTGAPGMFNETFYNCTGLTTLPAGLFSSLTTGASEMFQYTFYGCTGLTTLPSDLFSSFTTGAESMFSGTFSDCTGLTTLPSDLFSSFTTGASNMFYQTFSGCTGLTTLPSDLFSNFTTGASSMFSYTFSYSGLTSIPSDLFSKFTTGAYDMFENTFNGCEGLATLPDDLFASFTTGAEYMFQGTFSDCTGLTSIGDNVFGGFTTGANGMFSGTFYNCTGLTSIPHDLFATFTTGASSMFSGTFQYCTGLTSIPHDLFATFTTGAESMFSYTFSNCTGLTSLPAGLFASFTTGEQYMFQNTFYNCPNLSGYIPPSMFAGLIAKGSPTYSSFMSGMFSNTGLATSCSTYPNTKQYTTRYESQWNSKVSCISTDDTKTVTYSCGAGTGNAPVDSKEYVSGEFAITMLNTCTAPSGKGFINWLCGETNVGAGDKFTITANTTCTAQYADAVNNVTYSCGAGTGTAPTDSNSYASGANVTTLSNTCTAPESYDFKNWLCGETNVSVGETFTINANTTCVAQYTNYPFSVTTTYLNANSTFYFSMSAAGTFIVDCGDGGVLSGNGVVDNTITRTNTASASYTCRYSTAGVKTIKFGGTATEYNTSYYTATISFSSNNSIASISGNLAELFPQFGTGSGQIPRFYQTFYNATNLTSIPSTLFNGYTTGAENMFYYTFNGCTGLTTLPDGLFSSFTTGVNYMFYYTFYGCTGLTTLPSDLFSNFTTGAEYMFTGTFNDCTGLTSLPSDLFASFTTGAYGMFSDTFSNCTGLTSLPHDLFATFTTGAEYMFTGTFNDCTGLTSLPSDLFASFTTGASSMFEHTFYNCTGLTSIPHDLFATFTTGAEYMFTGTFNDCTGLTSLPSDLFASFTTGASYMFEHTFENCTGLTTIPSDLFASFTTGASNMFQSTFENCTGLTTIPSDLFASFTTGASYMFEHTFENCTGLTTIPSDLFASFTTGASSMFSYTFSNCTGLTSLPSDLFSNFTTGATSMFNYTFAGCSGLTSLPAGLFASFTTGAPGMFYSTFQNCTNLSGYIPPTMFAGLIANGSPNYTNFMSNMFSNTGLATSCSAYPGMAQYKTGYESQWNYKVSCTPASPCPAGEYLPKNSSVCIECPRDQYCVGGTYTFDKKIDQGNIMCPGDQRAPQGMSRATQCGRRMNFTLDDGLYVYMHGEKKTDMAVNIDMDMDGTAEYFGNMTTIRVPMNIDFANKPNHNKWVFELYDDFVNSAGKTIKAGTYYVYDDSMTYDFSKIDPEIPGIYTWSKGPGGMCLSGSFESGHTTTKSCDSDNQFSELNKGEWKTSFGYGTVYGSAVCSATNAEVGTTADSVSSETGTNCWCKVTGVIPNGQTVKLLPSDSLPWYRSTAYNNNCDNYCADTCSHNFMMYSSRRFTLLNQSN